MLIGRSGTEGAANFWSGPIKISCNKRHRKPDFVSGSRRGLGGKGSVEVHKVEGAVQKGVIWSAKDVQL